MKCLFRSIRAALNRMAEQQRKVNRAMLVIRQSRTLSGDEKTESLNRLFAARNRMAQAVEGLEPLYREK